MTQLARLLTNVGVFIGGIFLIGASIVITIEVLLRKFANTSLEGLHEISGFAMAVTFAWAMPFTILTRGHIRVDVVYALLRPSLKLGLDLFAAVAFSFYLVVVAVHAYTLTMASWTAGTLASGILGIPLAIPQAMWALGLAVATLVLVVAFATAAHALLRGRVEAAAESLAPFGAPEDEGLADKSQASGGSAISTGQRE